MPQVELEYLIVESKITLEKSMKKSYEDTKRGIEVPNTLEGIWEQD